MTSVQQIVAYVQDTYGVAPDCPFQDTEALVFRHAGTRKWFAVLMTVKAAVFILKTACCHPPP